MSRLHQRKKIAAAEHLVAIQGIFDRVFFANLTLKYVPDTFENCEVSFDGP